MMMNVSLGDLVARLTRLARSLGHSADEAEDLAQDCMLALASGSYRGDASVQTWLYRVLWNKHVDRIRARRERLGIHESVPAPSAPDHAEAIDHVRATLMELPDRPRIILILRYFEDLAFSEIALVVDRTLGTVKSDCFRALEQLRRLLDEKFGQGNVREWL
jgi:RNA polymerase sigma-70 factor (ECF subfamily)